MYLPSDPLCRIVESCRMLQEKSSAFKIIIKEENVEHICSTAFQSDIRVNPHRRRKWGVGGGGGGGVGGGGGGGAAANYFGGGEQHTLCPSLPPPPE